ncbi:hypothetical protein [Streptomyces sp. NPDC018045]
MTSARCPLDGGDFVKPSAKIEANRELKPVIARQGTAPGSGPGI